MQKETCHERLATGHVDLGFGHGMLVQPGCKKAGAFSIIGVLVLNTMTTYDNNTSRPGPIAYRFSGTETAGELTYYPAVARFYGGNYQVTGNTITFTFHYGRGPLWNSYSYTGNMYPEENKIIGSLSGQQLPGGQVLLAWTGTFEAVKSGVEA